MEEPMRKAVIVSLDAFYRADVDRLNPEGALAGILRDGTWCRRVETVFPALTYPIHATMVTGCDPDRTGVGQNQPFQPGTPKPMRKWYWERKHIRVPTLFEAVKEAGGNSCSILWPVNCMNPAVRWLFPEVHPLQGESALRKVLRYGTPLYILSEERRFGHLRSGISEPGLSDYAAALGADTIRRKKPDLTAIHLIDLDVARHTCGTFSPEADAAVARNDGRLKDILAALRETPGMENALLIVVSDHGQEDIRRTVNLTKTLDALGVSRNLQAQSNGMTAYFFPGPEGAGDMAALTALLEKHRAEMGVSRFYSRAEMDAMHGVEGPVLAAEAEAGVVFSDCLDEEKREKATHGFGPGRDADNCLFAVYGRGVRKGAEIPRMQMRDVGPTIAGLMGLELPEAQGEDLSSLFLE